MVLQADNRAQENVSQIYFQYQIIIKSINKKHKVMENEIIVDKYPSKKRYIVKVLLEIIKLKWIYYLLLLLLYFILNHVKGRCNLKKKGKNVKMWPTVLFRNPENIVIGDNSFLNHNNIFWAGRNVAQINIGNNVMFGPNVTVLAYNHAIIEGVPLDEHYTESSVIIGNNCWIGAGSVILPGVTIGQNTIIGAGSVVTKNFPSFTICVGNPAKPIKSIK